MRAEIVLAHLVVWGSLVAPGVAGAANVSDFIEFSLVSGGSTVLPGRLYVPPEATSDPNTPRPLILFLHGGGESGTNNVAQVNANIDNLLAEAKSRGAFLYAPQTANNWGGVATTDRVMTMIDRALEQMNVDGSRVYVTGLSNGGGGTWNMLSRYVGRFAAAIPICGVLPASGFLPANLLDVGLTVFHARDDNVVPVGRSRLVINLILTAAGEALPTYPTSSDPPLFVYENANLDLFYIEPAFGGHAIWPAVYSIPEVYDWLFTHSLAVPEPTTLQLAAAIVVLFARSRRPRPQR